MPEYAWYTKPRDGVFRFQIQLWDGGKYETTAATNSIKAAHAAFEAVCAEFQGREVTLQQAARVLRSSLTPERR